MFFFFFFSILEEGEFISALCLIRSHSSNIYSHEGMFFIKISTEIKTTSVD